MCQPIGAASVRIVTVASACCLAAMLLVAGGCELPVAPESAVAESSPPEPAYPEPKDDEAEAGPAKKGSAGNTAGNAQTDGAGTADGSDPNGATDGGGDVVKAEPFAGKVKRNEAGVITTPINAYFSAKQQITFGQIRNGLKIFQSINGRKPKDINEVMTRIVKPRGLILPELQPGDKYIFDPDAGPHGDIMILKAPK